MFSHINYGFAAIYCLWTGRDVATPWKPNVYNAIDTDKLRNRSELDRLIYILTKQFSAFAGFHLGASLYPSFAAQLGFSTHPFITVIGKIALGWFLTDILADKTTSYALRTIPFFKKNISPLLPQRFKKGCSEFVDHSTIRMLNLVRSAQETLNGALAQLKGRGNLAILREAKDVR